MIKDLSKKIFILIIVTLLIIILGVILLFTILNYNNAIQTASFVMDRFIPKDIRRDERIEPKREIDIEGIYSVLIENGKIILTSENLTNSEIEQYAIKVSMRKSKDGIIGDYIYKIRRIRENSIQVMLMENPEIVSRVKIIFITSIVLAIFAILLVYIIAKKVSKWIVKPVEETFEKQKQFISDASHELKTPLAVIEANADVLENEIGDNKWLKYIQEEIGSMNKLINELLLLAKIENIDNLRQYEKFDLSKKIEMIVSMFESMAYEKNIELKSNIEENVIINGAKEDIEHILSTLIDNAIKHTEEKKQVLVELSKGKQEIILQVKNQGEEIPKDEREKIFERFYRIDKARNRREKRYGLGLAIAKSIVGKYKGRIEVGFNQQMTIFKVIIPI